MGGKGGGEEEEGKKKKDGRGEKEGQVTKPSEKNSEYRQIPSGTGSECILRG